MPLAGKTKQHVVSEFRSAEILAAARKVFGVRGFDAATVEEIAEAAGLAKGTVYLYFPSKRDIYLAALKHGAMELRERTRENMDAAKGIQAKLRSFIDTRVQYAEKNRDFIKIYHSAFGSLTHPAAIDSEFTKLYLQQAKALEAVLQAAMDKGEIRHFRADFAAFIIYDMVRGVMTQRMLQWSKAAIEEDIELLCELVWKGVVSS
jgi:AcrR family transcriptional regulator